MITLLKKIFNIGPSVNISELLAEGAIIIDVRTKGEFSKGHVKGSINLPLDQLTNSVPKLKKDTTIITCCASGMRSSIAKSQLKAMGYQKVFNGKSWYNVNNAIVSNKK